jgi:methylenetetrahydrofolate reductase (NADPH)
MHSPTDRTAHKARGDLQDGFSLEITGKDTEELRQAAAAIPPGTRVNITFLSNEDAGQRVEAARLTRELGLEPVPHVSARRLRSRAELGEFLAALAEVNATEDVFVVAGDPTDTEGPFDDSLAVIRSGVLAEHGVSRVGIAGYPDGHPKIDDEILWKAIEQKWVALREQNLECSVISQFGFDTTPVVTWIEQLRSRGITCPVRVGVPGPAGVQRLLRTHADSVCSPRPAWCRSTASRSRSNHTDVADDVRFFGIPFFHVPSVAGPDKAESEAQIIKLLADNVDLVVLARYMQILSGPFLKELGVQIINIHHSFLRAFIGAGPYQKAKERGVKLIGSRCPCGGGEVRSDRGRVGAQWSDADRHVGEKREAPEDLVEFLVAVHLEDREVGVLAGTAPDVAPLPGPLPSLRVGLLPGEEVAALRRVHIRRECDGHPDREELCHCGSSAKS